jgi:hypothetical protein
MITEVIVVPRRFASEAQCRLLAPDTLMQRLTSGSEGAARNSTRRYNFCVDLDLATGFLAACISG